MEMKGVVGRATTEDPPRVVCETMARKEKKKKNEAK